MEIELQIGQVANLLGITPKTIRHYHKLGLLPEPERAENGYRVYTLHSLYRLSLIKSLKHIGFSLKDILAIIDADNSDERLHEELYTLQHSIEAQIQALHEQKALVQNLISNEVSLQETSQAEFPIASRTLMPVILQHLDTTALPQMMAMEQSLHENLDKFWWGDDYQQLMQDVAHFIETKPDVMQHFAQSLEHVKDIPIDDPQFKKIVEDVKHQIENTPLLSLFTDSQFAQDKNHTPMFLSATENSLENHLTDSQKYFLECLSQR